MANKYWVANAPNSSKITKEEAGSISDIFGTSLEGVGHQDSTNVRSLALAGASVSNTDFIKLSTIKSTASNIDQSCDVSKVPGAYTTSTAVAGVNPRYILLNSVAVEIAITGLNFETLVGSLVFIKCIAVGGGEAHTVAVSPGTFDGTNTLATFDAADEFLLIYVGYDGVGNILINSGSVGLSAP